MEYEIDLRRYVVAIVRRWRLIVASAVLAALLAAGWGATRPREYTASASLLITIIETGTQLGPDRTLLGFDTIDATARRQTIAALAQSAAVEMQLPSDVLERVAPDDYKPGMLIHNEQVTVGTAADLMVVNARAATPEQAKELADAWAETAVAYIKPLFTDQHSDVQLASKAALPFEPARRGIVRNALSAGVAGALFGIIIALALELVRRPASPLHRSEGERVVREPVHSR